jgi:ATP-dependent helicase/nuclease subunit B
MAGGELKGEQRLLMLARALDHPAAFEQIPRPASMPSAEQRHVDIAVTDMDRLKADPFAFYARKILRLTMLDRVDADPGPAWRGTLAHDILQNWFEKDRLDYDALIARTHAALDSVGSHPVVRALWTPRLLAAIRFVGEETLRLAREEGRTIAIVEEWGEVEISGIRMLGRADRVDRMADGSLAIVDYKTGKPPTSGAVTAGYALQLGLLGLMAARGGIKGITGSPSRFEYWSLARNDNGGFGYIKTPFAKQADRAVDESNFLAHSQSEAEKVIAEYILGNAPFVAKLHPEYAPYGDYDQLMRLDEWYGRDESNPA